MINLTRLVAQNLSQKTKGSEFIVMGKSRNLEDRGKPKFALTEAKDEMVEA